MPHTGNTPEWAKKLVAKIRGASIFAFKISD
jgi:hypothetical protein